MDRPGTNSDAGSAAPGGTRCHADNWLRWSPVLLAVNVIVPAMAGLWLTTRGQILDVAMGVALGFLMPITWVAFAIRPGALLTSRVPAPGAGSKLWLVTCVAFVVALWQYAVLAAWTLGVFALFGRNPQPGDLPVLMLWAYGAVMAPMTEIAQRKLQSDPGRTIAVCFAFGASVLAAIGCIMGLMADAAWNLGALTLAGAISTAALVARATQRQDRAEAGSAEDWSKPRDKQRAA